LKKLPIRACSRRVLRALGRHIAATLQECGASLEPPQGGFYLFPDFGPVRERLNARGIRSNSDLCARLLDEAGVATLPGTSFGRPAGELTLRIAYVDFDGARALAAARAVAIGQDLDEAFLRNYCGPTMDGVDRIRKWIES
jgi:aspartate aminotransferase